MLRILKIIDLRELAYILSLQIVLKFTFIDFFNFTPSISNNVFFILITSLQFFFISKYLINAYFFTATPENKDEILIYFFCSIILGLLSSFILFLNLDNLDFLFLFTFYCFTIILAGCSIETNTTIDTVVSSILTTFSFLIVWQLNQPTSLTPDQWSLFLDTEIVIALISVLIFVGQFIRSALLGLKNLVPNKKENTSDSLASVFGEKKTKIATIIASLVASLGIVFIVGIYLKNINIFHTLIYFAFIPQILLILKLKKAKTSKDYGFILKTLDIILFTGVLSLPLIFIFLKNAS